MSRRHIYVPNEVWDGWVERAARDGLNDRRKPYSVSEWLIRRTSDANRDQQRTVPEVRREPSRTVLEGTGEDAGLRVRRSDGDSGGRSAPVRRVRRQASAGGSRGGGLGTPVGGSTDLGECAKCTNPAIREHYPYCSTRCAK